MAVGETSCAIMKCHQANKPQRDKLLNLKKRIKNIKQVSQMVSRSRWISDVLLVIIAVSRAYRNHNVDTMNETFTNCVNGKTVHILRIIDDLQM